MCFGVMVSSMIISNFHKVRKQSSASVYTQASGVYEIDLIHFKILMETALTIGQTLEPS